MFCTECGNEIKDGCKFCTNCGKEIISESKERISILKIIIAIILFIAIISTLVVHMILNVRENTQESSTYDANKKDAIEFINDGTISNFGAYFYISDDEISKAINRCNKKYDYELKYSKEDELHAMISYKKGSEDVNIIYMGINNFGVVEFVEIILEDEKSKECLKVICTEIFSQEVGKEIIKCMDELGEYEYRFTENRYYLYAQNILLIIPGTEEYKKDFIDWIQDESTQELINPNNLVLKENPVKASR